MPVPFWTARPCVPDTVPTVRMALHMSALIDPGTYVITTDQSHTGSKGSRLFLGKSPGGVSRHDLADGLVLAILIVCAIGLRLAFLDFKSLDFYASLKPWYNTLRDLGFAAFATAFSTYSPPYLYLLYLIARFLPDLPVVVAVKLPSLLADFLCALLVFMIVRDLLTGRKIMPILSAVAVLFAPSVVLNSAFWGQADSLYTVGLLACTYLLMRNRPAWAMVALGIALSLKLQAIFVAPVILALAARGDLSWRSLLIVPGMLLLSILPAWAAGRPLGELIGIYAYQASQFEFLTMNAPSVYAWLPDTKQVFNLIYVPGVLFGAGAAFGWFVLALKSKRQLEGRLLLEVMLISALVVPFFLPKMHERYFYAADVLSIAFAFVCPTLFYIPILVEGVSFFAYQPFLFERELVPLPVLTLVLGASIALLAYHSIRQLYAPHAEAPAARASNRVISSSDTQDSGNQ